MKKTVYKLEDNQVPELKFIAKGNKTLLHIRLYKTTKWKYELISKNRVGELSLEQGHRLKFQTSENHVIAMVSFYRNKIKVFLPKFMRLRWA